MKYWDYRAKRLELLLSAPPASKMSDQKFWAFLFLIASVLVMAAISILISAMEKDGTTTDPTVLQAKLAILNMAMGGLIGGFGAASQAFFRSSQTDQDTASAMKSMAASLPVAPTLGTPPTTPGVTTTTTVTEPAPANGTPAGTPDDPIIVAGAPEGTPAVRTKPEKKP